MKFIKKYNIWILLLIISIFRLLLSNTFPLTADESYYWVWGKNLDLSYVDHPPMVAIINFLATGGREIIFTLRLASAALVFLISIAIYFLAKEIFNEKVAFYSTFLLNVIPHYFVVWLTLFVDLPMALFWTISLFLLVRIVKYKTSYLWYILGISLGLGYLSKYTTVFFWPCLCLYLSKC